MNFIGPYYYNLLNIARANVLHFIFLQNVGDGGYVSFGKLPYKLSDKSWRAVLLVHETGVPTENHRPVASH